MRDAVKIIDRAIERINDPLVFARLVTDYALFSIERVLRERRRERAAIRRGAEDFVPIPYSEDAP